MGDIFLFCHVFHAFAGFDFNGNDGAFSQLSHCF